MSKTLCVICLLLALPLAASGKGGPKPVKHVPHGARLSPQLLEPVSTMTTSEKAAFAQANASAHKLTGAASAMKTSVLILRKFYKIKLARQQAGVNVLTGLP